MHSGQGANQRCPLLSLRPPRGPAVRDGSAERVERVEGPLPCRTEAWGWRSRSRAPRSCPEHSLPLALPARTAFLCREGQLGGCLVLFAFKFSMTQSSCCSIRRLATKKLLSSCGSANRQKRCGQACSSGRVLCRWRQSRLCFLGSPSQAHLAQASVQCVHCPLQIRGTEWGT